MKTIEIKETTSSVLRRLKYLRNKAMENVRDKNLSTHYVVEYLIFLRSLPPFLILRDSARTLVNQGVRRALREEYGTPKN